MRGGLRLKAAGEALSWESQGLQVMERLETPCASMRLKVTLAWPAGTTFVVLDGGGWFVERTFDMAFMPC